MQVVCTGCQASLSWNPKTSQKRLRDLICPACGSGFRKARFEPGPDPLAEARVLTARMESATERFELAVNGMRDLGPALISLGQVLTDLRRYEAPAMLLKGGKAVPA